jgi:general secretion pathway protein M
VTPSRSAAIVILLALMLLIGSGIALPYARLVADLNDRVDQRQAVLDRYQALEQAAVAEPAPSTGLEVSEASAAQAAARVQETIAGFAGAADLRLDGMQVLRDDRPETGRVALRLRGAGGLAAVQRFLHAIETNRPVLIVDNLRLQARPGPATKDMMLDVQLDVVAFTAAAS